MSHKSYTRQLSAWGIPAIYAGIAMAAAFDSLVQIVFGPRRSTELGSKSPPEEGLSK